MALKWSGKYTYFKGASCFAEARGKLFYIVCGPVNDVTGKYEVEAREFCDEYDDAVEKASFDNVQDCFAWAEENELIAKLSS